MARNLLPVASLLLSVFFMMIGGGLAGYLLPLRAVGEGWSTFHISMIATSYSLFFTLGCLVVPRMVLRVGHVRVFAVLASLMSISLLMHALIVEIPAWILIRGIAGFSIAGGYMVIESWLNERVTNDTRGAVFSVYMVVSMIGLMAGQYIVPLGNPMLPTLFMVCAVIYAMALIPTGLSNAQSPQPLTQVSIDLKQLYLTSPAAVIGCLLAGVIGGSWLNLAPVYAQLSGLSTTSGATMLALAMFGGALLQIPLGRMSDRMDRRYVMAFAGGVGAFMCALAILFGTGNLYVFFIVMFLLGTVLFPIYALSVAHANDHAGAHEFVTISSGLLIVYGIGTVVGPMISGALMDQMGPFALFIITGVSFLAFALHSLYRSYRRQRATEDERVEFQPIPVARYETPQTYELDPRVDIDPEENAEKA